MSREANNMDYKHDEAAVEHIDSEVEHLLIIVFAVMGKYL
jgi:hypothetical protein